MQVNVAGIRRNLKNIAHNYSEVQKMVREATSNDPWGPDSKIMAKIADQTYNMVAFTEIMQLVWCRLNDHGRNWRHVFKTLVLLDYLIKTGSEKVSQQCKENIFAIQTLKDFQYLEDDKDIGHNVREKAKQLVNLLKDEERLKNERARALKAKERFAQNTSGFGSDRALNDSSGVATSGGLSTNQIRNDWRSETTTSSAPESVGGGLPSEIEHARPQTAGEEELQLQLALAMSREEAELEEQKQKSDDVRLQLALSQSQNDFQQDLPASTSGNLLDISVEDDTKMPPGTSDLWKHKMTTTDPWLPELPTINAWNGQKNNGNITAPSNDLVGLLNKPDPDPWSITDEKPDDCDEFDVITKRNMTDFTPGSQQISFMATESKPLATTTITTSTTTKKTPHSFLGENSALVNLDNLLTTTGKSVEGTKSNVAANPFANHPLHYKPSPPMNHVDLVSKSGQPIGGSNNNTNKSGSSSNDFPFSSPQNVRSTETANDPWQRVPPTTYNNHISSHFQQQNANRIGDDENPFVL